MSIVERMCYVDVEGIDSKYLPSVYTPVKFHKGKYSNDNCSIETKEGEK